MLATASLARSARGPFPHPEQPRRAVAVPAPSAAARSASPQRVVLYVHGATFPSALSIAHRFDGRSWRDELCAAGLRCLGSGFSWLRHSDPYPAMSAPPEGREPLCTAEDASQQLNRQCGSSVGITRSSGFRSSRIPGARSWPVASPHAALRLVDRLVLFGAIARRNGSAAQRLSGMAPGFATGSMAALHRGGAVRRIPCAVAPTFR